MSAAEHLAEAIAVGCSRDDHDHVGDHRREVLEAAIAAVEDPTRRSSLGWESARDVLRRMAEEEGKGTGTTGGEPTPQAMSAADHYREAERLLSDASFTSISGQPVTRDGRPLAAAEHAVLVARAQVHATLATGGGR